MRFSVNADCIGCGLCAGTCPEVFSMTDDGTAQAVKQDVPEKDENAALEAMLNCPVSAIERQ